MDQIRNTMMQHEALFKEQVQALHKLYDIQLLAMQEIRRTCSQAQVLTFSSERVLLKDDPSSCSILEGKPLRPAYATGRAYKEEYLALSLRPFVTLREFKGSGSFLMDGVGNENFCSAERKPMRNLDLEKLPEDFIDEPEVHVRPYNCEQINMNCDQASEDKAFEIDVKKCVTSSLESNSTTTEKNASEEAAWKHSPPVGSPSTNGQVETPTLQHQGSSILMNGSDAINFKQVHVDTVLDLGKGSSCTGSFEKHQDVGFGSTITRSPNLEESSCYSSGVNLPKNPTICHQGSSITESLLSEPKGDNIRRSLHMETSSNLGNQNLTLQTSIYGKNDNPKDLSDGSNSVLSQETTTCKNENESAYTEDSEKGRKNLAGGEAVHEECESIAAEILLSFAPSRKIADSQFHCTQAKADDSSQCCRDNDSNRNPYHTKYPNCSLAGGTNDSTTCTKSVSRRRTSRRPQ